MRLFLGIDIPDDIRNQIDEQLDPMKKEYPQLAWVPKKNYHITVEFFGETMENKLALLIRRIDDLLYDQEELYMFAGECNLFVTTKLTMYLNFIRDKKLELLVETIRGQALEDAIPRKKFIAHLSLARSRVFSKQQYFVLKKKIEKLRIDAEFPVKELILFESNLQGRVPEYEKIHSFPLNPHQK